MDKKSVAFLEGYYTGVCDRPTLDEIQNLGKFLGIRKESIYWWFVNRNKRQKTKTQAESSSVKQDVKHKGRIDRVPLGVVEGRKKQVEKRV